MDDFEKRVSERAYKLWVEEGRPEGRASVHWDKACELVAIEENLGSTLKPVPRPGDVGPYGEPVEPLAPARNVGDTPTIVDQGEEETLPDPRNLRGNDGRGGQR